MKNDRLGSNFCFLFFLYENKQTSERASERARRLPEGEGLAFFMSIPMYVCLQKKKCEYVCVSESAIHIYFLLQSDHSIS